MSAPDYRLPDRFLQQLLLAAGLALLTPACAVDDHLEDVAGDVHADDHDDHDDQEDPDAEACEHLAEGPAIAAQAVSEVTSPALADVGEPHTRYDIALTDVTDGKGGWVRLPVAAAGDYIVFLDADVALAAFAGDGTTAREAEDVDDHSDACETIRGRHVFEFPVGETLLWFGPAATDAVSVVIEAAGDHEDHDHGHEE